MKDTVQRCEWATHSLLEQRYHDEEWGVPVHDDRKLFRKLMLDCQQAGLSWSTILKKMDTLCAAYDDFDPDKLAAYDAAKIETLLADPGIIRNKQKVNAMISNAQAYLRLVEKVGSFDGYLWAFVDGEPLLNSWTSPDQVPVTTDQSDALSKDLKKRGFKFVGSTTVYAFMQAVGMVNDHMCDCAFRDPNR